jgi:murein DD-endopeptidase MepM/ murein hydrolase activator NlpD
MLAAVASADGGDALDAEIARLGQQCAASPGDAATCASYRGKLVEKANALYFGGQQAASLPYYDRASQVVPEDAGTWNVYGNALRFAGRHDRAYAAFARAQALDPRVQAAGAPGQDNLRVGVTVGVPALLAAGDTDLAVKYAQLGHAAQPNDAGIRDALFGAYLAAKSWSAADALARTIPDANARKIHAAWVLLAKGQEPDAYAAFEAVSRSTGDPMVDDAIQSVYAGIVGRLPYDQQMASPLQDRVVEFATNAATKYFLQHPYTQTITLVPPLKGRFCLGQGAGGRSFHYGIKGHYSYDVNACKTDSMGTPVFAVADGKVIEVVQSNPDRPLGAPVDLNAPANWVKVRHGDVDSVYLHVKQGSARVQVGETVKAGQQVAEMGASGIVAGPHTHFNLVRVADGVPVPPTFQGMVRASSAGPVPSPQWGEPGTYASDRSFLQASPPVAPITIDGSGADWAAVPVIARSTHATPGDATLRGARVAVDAARSTLFFRVDYRTPFQTDAKSQSDSFLTIDFALKDTSGVDYRLNLWFQRRSPSLRPTNGGFVIGKVWDPSKWSSPDSSRIRVAGGTDLGAGFVEVAIPLDLIGSPAAFDWYASSGSPAGQDQFEGTPIHVALK